jgi:hypothetical protein
MINVGLNNGRESLLKRDLTVVMFMEVDPTVVVSHDS